MTKLDKRNQYCFGLGTIGRDMFYTLESMYLLYFLTEVRQLDDGMLALPLAAIVAGYVIYRRKYTIDAEFYEKIVGELKARGRYSICLKYQENNKEVTL